MNQVYVLCGDDISLISERVHSITKELRSSYDTEIILEELNLNDVTELDLFCLQDSNLTLFPTKTIFKIYVSDQCKKHLEKDSVSFIDSIKSISLYKTMIIVFYFEKLDKVSKKQLLESSLFNELKKIVNVEQYFKLMPWQQKEAKDRIKTLVSEYNLSLDEQALELFCNCLVDKSHVVSQELQKLQIYLLPNNFISENLIKDLYLTSSSVDRLYNSILYKKYDSIVPLISEITVLHHPLYLLASLQSKFRQALQIKLYKENLLNVGQISKAIGLHPYRTEKELEQLTSVSSNYLKNIVSLLSEIEFKIKSGVADANKALDLLVVSATC